MKNSSCDLHLHSTFSDGADTPYMIFEQAIRKHILTLSFVDHDTTATFPAVKDAAGELGLKLIPGIELSAYDYARNRKVHVLGYDYHIEAPHIRKICEETLKKRHEHSCWQLEQISAAGYLVNAEKIQACMLDQPIMYKQFIMAGLTSADFLSLEYQKLYHKLFKEQGIACGDIRYPDVHDVIEAIKKDGGFVVIAHPGQLDSYDLLVELAANKSIDGIELFHPDHSEQDHKKIRHLLEKHQLFYTGGSDYHGRFGAVDSLKDCQLPPLPFI